MANKITVTSLGTTANVNATPDSARYYSDKSKEWAISEKLIDNEDYSSKYYANESKKQADISTAKATEVTESGNTAVSNIESARDNAITDITNQESISVDNVNTAGATQVTLATNQANIATQQATIATNKASEVVASGNEALSNIDTAKNNAITAITTQETTSKNNVIATGNEQVERVNLTGVDNRTPIFTKSEVGTNEGVYQNVYDLKHSTFDLSKFSVVGSPTITEDGIASGFDNKQRLNCNLETFSIDGNNTVEIYAKVKHSIPTSVQRIISSSNDDFYIPLYQDASNYILNVHNPGSYIYLKIQNNNFVIGQDVLFHIKINNNIRSIKYSTDNGKSWSDEITKTTELTLPTITGFCLGNGYTYGSAPMKTGSIDLKHFSITVDGKEVFSGNKTGTDTVKIGDESVEIPYTLSKTGSKIVDVAYRDRVIDLYEQEGQAKYYTIDEPNKNFTLPMGEIYGMLGQRSLISSTVTETNRVDIYSDKTCLICGNVATAGTINLPIELVNNNYFITLSTSAKTATSFTTTATGDYILIGKVI